jgi:uncharacterized protein YfaS (alpha-2-macroglobulin family)
VATVGGVATERDQRLAFVARAPFTATLSCERENPDAACVPIAPIRLTFSASVAAAEARKAVIVGPEGRRFPPRAREREDAEAWVQEVTFPGPFPETSAFTLEIPGGLRDDAGRSLANAGRFPVAFRTDPYPPLAKFAADFGILELKGRPLLPVTLRNVEASLAARSFAVAGGADNADPPRVPRAPAGPRPPGENLAGEVHGRIFQVPTDRASQMLDWIKRLRARNHDQRGTSVFGPVTRAKARAFSVPKPRGPKAFEVVGIPLAGPGFYVVEIESEILGAALLGKPRPMFVPTAVLVTNLAAHFKWGNDSSLVWVTTLDRARPAPGAAVVVRDCTGKALWEGKTDASGLARIEGLPPAAALRPCGDAAQEGGLLVTAQLGADLALVHTTWNEGIEPWRFRLPTEFGDELLTARTVFDRTLLRAGDTVHMKHILRRRATAGFGLVPDRQRPDGVTIQHLGSEEKYELPLRWDASGAAESTWTIPAEAKLGTYQVILTRGGEPGGAYGSGEFRVEEFRVPLMRGSIQPPAAPLVAPKSVALDLAVSYLSGGGAGKLPVRLRWTAESRPAIEFDGFDDFTFGAGIVKEGLVRADVEAASAPPSRLETRDLVLEPSGTARTTLSDLRIPDGPAHLVTELEFRDPNGALQTVASRIPLWPAARLVGVRPESWTLAKESLKLQVAVVDLGGAPVAGAPVRVDLFQRVTYSHRKRLVGGFYAYEHSTEIKKVGALCEGKTGRNGILPCDRPAPVSGNVVVTAVTTDGSGRPAATHRDVWVAGQDDWWFAAEDGDRIDLIPERRRYEPGEMARFQVRMPFRKATALVTVEREGVAEATVREISGKQPVIEVPVKGNHAPNVFVSVLVVRGRAGGVQPTALVDLGRPAYKLGIGEIQVGWRAHELKVKVSPERPLYKVREKARVAITVTGAGGQAPPRGSEVAVAAVDEGLLELQPNASWRLLEAMMGRRSYGVETATAQMHVIGRRHFGLKALPQGGGGGKQATRELFDTLLLWKGRVALDEQGAASVEVPLNDSVTGFRIVAVATAGTGGFGTGAATIRTSQDLMILSGIAPLVRQGDRTRSTFTVRNASERRLDVDVSGRVGGPAGALPRASVALGPGEARELAWDVTVPAGADSLRYEIEARARDGAADRLSVSQRVVPAVPVRTFAATLEQVEGEARVEVARPRDALPGRGAVEVALRPTLGSGLAGVTDYMRRYPYTCLEQQASRAVALEDHALWERIVARLPAYLDSDGLARYFPSSGPGSDVLTAYLVALAAESGWGLPESVQERMLEGLRGFVQGRIARRGPLAAADLVVRKLGALAALVRVEKLDPALLASIPVDPNLWPTSAVLDWSTILERTPALRNRAERLHEADQILHARLAYQGTVAGFSTESSDRLWWLMVSADGDAARLLLARAENAGWRADVPRLARGVLARQRQGHWDTTVANAWGVLALRRFSRVFEPTPVGGTTSAQLGSTQSVDWSAAPKGKVLQFPWPAAPAPLVLRSSGPGRPWATVRALAAVPLREPVSAGFKVRRSVTPLEPAGAGAWKRGGLVRVKLELEAQSDMTWVVVADPVPAGAAILGSGLGGDSELLTRGEERKGMVWTAFEERSFEAFRAYYEYVPKGTWSLEYTVRLNSQGTFQLPPTRVEALYAPEMFAEIPNDPVRVE